VTIADRQKTEGYLLLLLHAHLPYIRYPEHEQHLEETWLHEAIIESYIPLLAVFDDLLNDKTDFRITLSLTPSLLEMLSDKLLMARFQQYLDSRIDLAERERARTRSEPGLGRLAQMYYDGFLRTKRLFEDTYQKDLISAFRSIFRSGKVELITSAATHAYLPLHISEPDSIRTQLALGVNTFRQHFDTKPSGIWLPECGYAPGLDELITAAGINYFFLESHGLLNAAPKPKKSIYRPVRTPSGAVAFGRDTESAKQVWSSRDGYPGDADYRDFYRDIGFDLDHEYLKPYLPGGTRTFTGIKYFRITGKTEHKELYDREQGLRKAALHAEHFMQEREKQVLFLRERLKIRPVITAAYDAELFGHWWYEGPEWLRFVLRNLSLQKRPFRFITPSEFCSENRVTDTVAPSASSWGKSGYSAVWLDPSNSWVYRHLKKASEKMTALSRQHQKAEGLLERALNQALRELLIAQASDWPFMMKMGSAAQFAETKLREHISNFFVLCGDIDRGKIRETAVASLENKTGIFRDIDFRTYSAKTAGDTQVV
jgi:1,4-alpha-glucan branching enzyme